MKGFAFYGWRDVFFDLALFFVQQTCDTKIPHIFSLGYL